MNIDFNNKNKWMYNKKQGGQVMLISVIFFLLVTVSTISGLVAPTVKSFHLSNNNILSKQSFFLSEAGGEDAYYRLKNSMPIGSSTVITLNGNTATTSIVDSAPDQKTVTISGDVNSRQRLNEIVLTTSQGASFYYGIQVGQGGVYLNNGTINGNIYANGPITASTSAGNLITGSAVSANSPAAIADQSNEFNFSNDVIYARTNGGQDIAQSFQVSTLGSPLNKIELYLKKVGAPSDSTVKIVNDNAGSPGSTVLASGTLLASAVTTSYGWVEVSFDTNPLLSVGTTYWYVVDGGYNSTNYYTAGANNNGYISGIGKIGKFGTSWFDTNPIGLDYFFKIYLGGVTGLIAGAGVSNPLIIGSISGNVAANTVNNVTAPTGTIYCQSGSGNNKVCTPATDPAYVAYPISDANITEWEGDALLGGIHTGNYSVGGAGATLGPKKIVGNLGVSSGGTLTVTGTLWVTGNLTLSGNGHVVLDPAYGTNDGVIIVDGVISMTGGANASGSGSPGSYIMLLSKSYSTLGAITISGGAGAVIAYAPNGKIVLSGGASLQEATGYQIDITGGSSVTYESGLASSYFSSGPGGGWDVMGWKEVQ